MGENSPKVVNFQAEASVDVVELLSNFLESAKKGEYVAVAIAAVRNDSTVTVGFSKAGRAAVLLGGVSYLAYSINSVIDE